MDPDSKPMGAANEAQPGGQTEGSAFSWPHFSGLRVAGKGPGKSER